MPTKYSKENFNKNLSQLKKQSGGENANKRTFKILELNGKVVDFGHLTIKKKTSSGNPGPGPSSAAKKALSSIAKHLKTKKHKLDVKFNGSWAAALDALKSRILQLRMSNPSSRTNNSTHSSFELELYTSLIITDWAKEGSDNKKTAQIIKIFCFMLSH